MSVVYLLHFKPSLKQSKHYCGSTPADSATDRIIQHKLGKGAKITQAQVNNGGGLHLAKQWHFTTPHQARLYERMLKDTHNLKHYCPLCSKAKVRQLKLPI